MLIYIDTNIWIYAYENDAVLGELARRVLHRARAKQHQLAGSLLVLSELLVLPTYENNASAMETYRNLFASRNVRLLSYGAGGLEDYVFLRAYRRLSPIDALHLATAVEAEADLFLTEDSGLLSQPDQGKTRIVDLPRIMTLL